MNGTILTYTGKRFSPLDPKVEDIDINDIAQSLSNQCRFAGHCPQFYSVAQHSVLVSNMCPPEDALYALLHDASEAYLVDIPSPLKASDEFEGYRKAEARLMHIICEAYDLPKEEPASVREADKRMLVTEARDLTLTEGRGWNIPYEAYDFSIKPWIAETARAKFLSKFHELIMIKKR